MKKFCVLIASLCLFFLSLTAVQASSTSWWQIQSIDTKKYSLDQSTQMAKSPETFRAAVAQRVKTIAQTGATHITIETPYDEKYIPVMMLWIQAARDNGLKVWFRGSFPGEMTNTQAHTKMVQEFLDTHASLFEEGDVFSSCPECKSTTDVDSYRAFLVSEYTVAKESFFHMGKNVVPDLFPMTIDQAKTILNEDTTRGIGGYVTVDLDATDSASLVSDVNSLESQTKGKIVIASIVAPTSALSGLVIDPSIMGVTYTEPHPQLTEYFEPKVASGKVSGRDSAPLAAATVATPLREVFTDEKGQFVLPLAHTDSSLSIRLAGYHPQELKISPDYATDMDIRLEKEQYSVFDRLKLFILRILPR